MADYRDEFSHLSPDVVLDMCAFTEQAALDDSGDLGPDVGHLEGRDPSGQLLLERRAALLNDDVADRGRSARAAPAAAARLLAGRAAAAACRKQQRDR